MVDAEVKRGVLEGVRVLEELGASTREVSVPLVSQCMEIGTTIIGAEDHRCSTRPVQRRAQQELSIPAPTVGPRGCDPLD